MRHVIFGGKIDLSFQALISQTWFYQAIGLTQLLSFLSKPKKQMMSTLTNIIEIFLACWLLSSFWGGLHKQLYCNDTFIPWKNTMAILIHNMAKENNVKIVEIYEKFFNDFFVIW